MLCQRCKINKIARFELLYCKECADIIQKKQEVIQKSEHEEE